LTDGKHEYFTFFLLLLPIVEAVDYINIQKKQLRNDSWTTDDIVYIIFKRNLLHKKQLLKTT